MLDEVARLVCLIDGTRDLDAIARDLAAAHTDCRLSLRNARLPKVLLLTFDFFNVAHSGWRRNARCRIAVSTRLRLAQ
jgi:hypothetical protein